MLTDSVLSDVGLAKSAPWNEGFCLVMTGFAEPVKPRKLDGKCEVVYTEGNTGKNTYRVWYVINGS
jgi:hypothetical protein